MKDSQQTEYKYLTKHIRYRFEFMECLSGVKIMVVFEKYTHWSIKGFHFKRKWRFIPSDFNSEIQKYSNGFCS